MWSTSCPGIVDFVDQLQAAPTDDVLPMAHPAQHGQRLRADDVTEPNERDFYQENAPATEDGYYLVPEGDRVSGPSDLHTRTLAELRQGSRLGRVFVPRTYRPHCLRESMRTPIR